MMHSQWAFHWVLWLQHHKKGMAGIFFGVTAVLLLGNVFESWLFTQDMLWLGASLLTMSLFAAGLMSSVRTAALMLLLCGLVLGMVTGGLGWMGLVGFSSVIHSVHQSEQVHLVSLAFLVVVTMMMSNFVHLLMGLHREMARGQFQHDALSETLRLNMQPLLLSNVTTALSFIVAAGFDASLNMLAWVVCLGAIFSLWVSVTWLPWILLIVFVECRVGEPKDRHGLMVVAMWLQKHGVLRQLLLVLGAGLGILAWIFVSNQLVFVQDLWWQIGGVFLGLTLILAWVWGSLKYALFNTFAGLYSVVMVTAVLGVVTEVPLSAWMLLVPLGLIIDDGVHFFVRFLRAKKGVFQQNDQAVRFTLVSIGRPIWVTSVLLMVGMLVLSLSGNPLIQVESWIVILSIVVMTFVVLYGLPAWLLSNS